MAAAFARAVNDWVKAEWLDRDPRLRASIVVPAQNIELAVDEVNRCSADPRFVQVLMLALGEMPLGKSHFWPIYRAAEKHGLTLGIHAGSTYHHAVTGSGWPSYYLEDYAAYYSRCFHSFPRTCRRLHFLSAELSEFREQTRAERPGASRC